MRSNRSGPRKPYSSTKAVAASASNRGHLARMPRWSVASCPAPARSAFQAVRAMPVPRDGSGLTTIPFGSLRHHSRISSRWAVADVPVVQHHAAVLLVVHEAQRVDGLVVEVERRRHGVVRARRRRVRVVLEALRQLLNVVLALPGEGLDRASRARERLLAAAPAEEDEGEGRQQADEAERADHEHRPPGALLIGRARRRALLRRLDGARRLRRLGLVGHRRERVAERMARRKRSHDAAFSPPAA